MLVTIDGNEANQKQRVGIGQYAWQLLRHLHQIDGAHQYLVYLKNKPQADLPLESDLWQYKIIGPSFMWTQWRLPLSLFLDQPRPQLFFSPSHYAPRFSPVPTVVSVMDLSFTRFPEHFKEKDLYQLVHWTAYSVKKAARVLTISQSSKNDLVSHYGLDPQKVVVTYPGFDKQIFHPNYHQTEINLVKQKYHLNGDYLISVGTIQPRKNYLKLIEAFAIVKRQFPSLQLVIVGKKGWMYQPVFDQVVKEGLQESVIFTDFVPHGDLALLYSGAKVFALVSLYEGFGIPAVEAMACGSPVVLSNVSSLPEVGGETAIYVDPNDRQQIASSIMYVMENEKVWQDKKIQSLEQSKKFSWTACARETLAVLEEVARVV